MQVWREVMSLGGTDDSSEAIGTVIENAVVNSAIFDRDSHIAMEVTKSMQHDAMAIDPSKLEDQQSRRAAQKEEGASWKVHERFKLNTKETLSGPQADP